MPSQWFAFTLLRISFHFATLFYRDGAQANFESWCVPGETYGCSDEDSASSSLSQVDFFTGSIALEPGTDICTVETDHTTQFSYNDWFGVEGEKASNAPHRQVDFNDLLYFCYEATTTTTTTTTTTATTTYAETTAADDKIVEAAISAIVENTLEEKVCIKTSHDKNPSTAENQAKVPGIDLFLNPDKEAEKMNIVQTKQGIAKEYFSSSDMASLYPNLFRILWQSTLPCFKVKYHHVHV